MRLCRVLPLALVLSVVAADVAGQSADLPPGVFVGGKTIADARAGSYALDPLHASVIARVSHLRYSYSIFRFDSVSGTLTWDPAAPEKSRLSVSVETASITSNVKGFAQELGGEKFLKSAAFPQATFVSTAFRQADATHGKVEGQFTLMGKTQPVTFDVELVGAGKGFGDRPRIGVNARAWIKPTDYGFPALFADPIEIVVDTEFERAP